MLRFGFVIAMTCLVFSVYAQSGSYLSKPAQEQLKALYTYESVELQELEYDEAAYLKSYECFLAYLASEDRSVVDSFMIACKQLKGNDFLLVNAEIQKAILLLLRGDEMSGVYAFYRAHQRFKQLKPEHSPMEYSPMEYKKLQGLFNVIWAQIPESYQFWSALLGLQGNETEGFQLLRAYLKDVRNQDAIYVEGLTLYHFLLLKFSEPSDSDVQLILDEVPRSESPLFYFVGSQVLMKAYKGHKATDLLAGLSDRQLNAFPLLYYIKGRLCVNQLHEGTVHNFKQFETFYRGVSFKTDAQLRLTWYYHLNQQYSKRDSLIASVNTETKQLTALDRQAIREFETVKDAPAQLLKARLLFDYGDFEQALQILTDQQSGHLNLSYQIEYNYRLARVQHELKAYGEALKLYSETISLAKQDKRYFGPYAAVKAAKIAYFQMADIDSAISYLRQAEELNNGEYQSAIKRQIRELRSFF
ncbi:hypothetical protein [Carboxylicivirga sp. N1Y90]|uniref:hypothetical protein n=1 Tax=Carboxylicivirga fragile TaxID=3417571 RepID=UPI003D33A76E|nr:hypothetical protein [Marinilabiliaceae bacterium N1Y90]